MKASNLNATRGIKEDEESTKNVLKRLGIVLGIISMIAFYTFLLSRIFDNFGDNVQAKERQQTKKSNRKRTRSKTEVQLMLFFEIDTTSKISGLTIISKSLKFSNKHCLKPILQESLVILIISASREY